MRGHSSDNESKGLFCTRDGIASEPWPSSTGAEDKQGRYPKKIPRPGLTFRHCECRHLRNTARDESYVTRAPLEQWEGLAGRHICATEHGLGHASHRKVALSTVPSRICSRPSGCPDRRKRARSDPTMFSLFRSCSRRETVSLGCTVGCCRILGRAFGLPLSSGTLHAFGSRQVTQATRNSVAVQMPGRRNGVHVSSESLKFNGSRKSWFLEYTAVSTKWCIVPSISRICSCGRLLSAVASSLRIVLLLGNVRSGYTKW